jgi:hypothetical protein
MIFVVTQCVVIGFLLLGLTCALFPRKMRELDAWLAGRMPWAPNPYGKWKQTQGFTTYLRVTGWIIAIVCILFEILVFMARSRAQV